jgi:hypothetical protein
VSSCPFPREVLHALHGMQQVVQQRGGARSALNAEVAGLEGEAPQLEPVTSQPDIEASPSEHVTS